jgi:type II secretory pathway component GspD/PulD (secretin)
VAADAAVFRSEMMQKVTREDRIRRASSAGFAEAFQDVAASAAVPVNDVTYPDNWREKDERKNRKYLPVKEQTPEDKQVYSKLSFPVSIDFKDKPLQDVLEELRELHSVNIVPDRVNIENEGIDLEQRVSIRLDGVSLKTALKHVLQNCRLTYVVQDGVLLVTTPTGERGKAERVVYPVADLIIPVENYGTVGSNNSPLGLGGPTKPAADGVTGTAPSAPSPWSIHGGPVVGDSMANALGKMHAHAGRAPRQPGQSMEDILIRLISETIEPYSWADKGGTGKIEYYPLGMSLVVSQTPDIQEQVQQLLDRLRELQELQVTVEVRFVTLSESFYERIGIDFDVQIDDDQTRFEPQVVANSFAPPGFINESDHLDNVVVGLTPAGNFTTDLDIPINSSSFSRAIPPFGRFPNSLGSNGGIDLGLAFLSDIEVFLFLEAAQGDQRSNLMQAPKLTLYNGQTATLNVTDSQFFVTNVVANTTIGGQTLFVPQNQPVQTGLTLLLQAVISADRRYVRVSLAPNFSSLSPNVPLFPITVFVTPIIADDIQGTPIPFQQFIQQPAFTSLSVSTTVSVPDGGTVLMGGLKTLNEGRNEFGPPILSKIPYINRLWRNQGYGRDATSLMIMVTPRIIIPEEEEERLGQTFAF